MDTLKEMLDACLLLLDAGAVVRFLYCIIRTCFNPDEWNSYKKKLVNLGIFIVFATCCITVSHAMEKYFM